MNYKKHKFNFFPEIDKESFENLKHSISAGFDSTLGKITLFQGEILDGWNRYRACQETETEPVFIEFQGSESDALDFSIKANQDRRHLTKSQLAAVAVDAEPLIEEIQKKVREEHARKTSEARIKLEREKREAEEREATRLQDEIRKENARLKREAEIKAQKEREKDEAKKRELQAEQDRIKKEREDSERKEKERKKQEVELIPPPAKDDSKLSRTKIGGMRTCIK